MSNMYGELAGKVVGDALKTGRGCMIWFIVLVLIILTLIGVCICLWLR